MRLDALRCAWATLLLAILFTGCGAGSASEDGGFADADLTMPDAASSDAGGPGSVADFGDCAVTADCENPNSDCVPLADLSGTPKQCLPRCTDIAQCPYEAYCYPEGLPATYGLMSGHCWFALCGEQLGRSPTGGPCQMGEGLGASESDLVDGFCWPIDDGLVGVCLETGTASAGQPCDFSTPMHGGANCTAQTLCVGLQGEPTGTCEPLCDPRLILTGQDTGCGPDAGCRDVSRVQQAQNRIFEQTLGYCAYGLDECTLLGSTGCPLSVANNPQACQPNNPLRPTGQCAEAAYGTLAAASQCAEPVMNTPVSERCESGTQCLGPDANSLTCETTCDVATSPVIDCGNLTCTTLLWSLGADQTPNTPDDIETLWWGVCR